ncbi:MAG TPA: hypothetical protein PLM24_04455 [Methanothrix sp.]|nr:hypothetical protein [Methanothrix sp.]HPR66369.1 hypothetical protein [Methanothrix sp.]
MEMKPFDPFEGASEIETIVMDGIRRKYYRFRYSRHYGGILTADAVGCNILCAYCWNYGTGRIRRLLGKTGLKVETEELNRYPFVMENLKKRGVEVKTI